MIVCVCGMIGAGKTTYCYKQNGIVSDFDEIGDKDEQIKNTLINAKKYDFVYHITCFPTQKELEAFGKYEVKYIWINTTFEKCKRNILKRNRKRDVKMLQETINKNREIREKYIKSRIKFEVVDVYDSDERW